MAAQRLLHPDGEIGAARAAARGRDRLLPVDARDDRPRRASPRPRAARCGFSSTSPATASAAPACSRAPPSTATGRSLLTVDLPVPGRRERELRHGATSLPDGVALTSHLGPDLAGERKPRRRLGRDARPGPTSRGSQAAGGLPVLVKGVLTAEDADAAVAAGADGIVVSNHGGRQLDGCLPTAVALREVAAAVRGRVPVLVDGGIRDGGDVVRALALGADAVLVGRPYGWGLATGGEAGVRAVLRALDDDLRRAMALAGCPALADIRPIASGAPIRCRKSRPKSGNGPHAGARFASPQPVRGSDRESSAICGLPGSKNSSRAETALARPLEPGAAACWDGPCHEASTRGGRGAWRRARATKKVACEDCFFHCNLLCALELDEPCATFRPDGPDGLRPPQQLRFTLPPGAPHAGGVGVPQRAGAGRAARVLNARRWRAPPPRA